MTFLNIGRSAWNNNKRRNVEASVRACDMLYVQNADEDEDRRYSMQDEVESSRVARKVSLDIIMDSR